MPAKNLKRIADEGVLLHIYNKGVEGSVIFKGDDFKVYINFLEESLAPPKDPSSIKQPFKIRGRTFKGTPRLPKNYSNQVELIGYNLKPDHFHLIIRQVTKGSVENFIRSLCTRYSMYFNKKYGRSGSLFAGPYKSVEITDEKSLQLLISYLNSEGGYVSHSEGKRNNPWINPETVNQSSLLKSIILDGNSDHLKGREPVGSTNVVPKTYSGFPRFLMVSGSIFVLLTSLGIGNILISSSKSKVPLPPPAILSVSKDLQLDINSKASEATSEAKSKSSVKVKIDDESKHVNIRQKPTTNSLKIGKARNGDIFEFKSLESGWYEVKFVTNSGFIAAEYIEKEGQAGND